MKNLIYKSIYPLFLFAGFSIALPPLFKSLSLGLLLIALLLNLFFNKNKIFLRQIIGLKNPLLYLALFYLLYCVGMFYTSDLKEGFKDLNIKLPFIIVPLIVCLTPKRSITKSRLWKMFLAFVVGLLIMQVYSLTNGFINAFSAEKFDATQLLYSKLAKKLHPTYFSLYTCMALIMIYFIPLKYISKKTKCAFAIRIILMSVFAIFSVMLNSRIGVLAMGFACVVIVFNEFIIKKGYINTLFYLVVCAVFVISLFVVTSVSNRYESIAKEVKQSERKGENVLGSAAFRGFMFGNFDELAMQNPCFGVGTGDVREELQKFYKGKGVKFSTYLNAHNQFIQTLIAIGLLGLLCFLLMLFMLSTTFWNKNGIIFLLSIAVVVICMMTESILERQQGVHFFAFYFAWICGFRKNKTRK